MHYGTKGGRIYRVRPLAGLRWIVALAALLALAACGSSSTPPAPGAATYAVGGTVSGLAGTGLTLQDNGGDDLAVTANGTFTFATKVSDAYDVTVMASPSKPVQACSVSNGSGTATADVTGVAIQCYNRFLDGSYWTQPSQFERVIVNAGGSNQLKLSADVVNALASSINVGPSAQRSSTSAAGQFQADVTVTAFSQTSADDLTRARIIGGYYNVALSPATRAGDVFAEVYLDDSTAWARAAKCGSSSTASSCNSAVTLTRNAATDTAAGPINLGAATLGTQYTLQITWDGGTIFTVAYGPGPTASSFTKSVTFDLNSAPDAHVFTLAANAGPAHTKYENISLRSNNAAGASDSITALYDNVAICDGGGCTISLPANLHDDFQASTILDRSKWNQSSASAIPGADGALVLTAQQEQNTGGGAFGATPAVGSNSTTSFTTVAGMVTTEAISADTSLDPALVDEAGGHTPGGDASLYLTYANGSNTLFIGLQLRAASGPSTGPTTYVANANAIVCGGGSCSTTSDSFLNFTTTITKGTTYPLKIVKTATGVYEMTVGSETQTLDLTTAGANNATIMGLISGGTFAGGGPAVHAGPTDDAGESASVMGTFANLLVGVP
jgi:hypothetical protein